MASSSFLGLFPIVIICAIVFWRKQKLSSVMYTLSAVTYISAIIYMIAAFKLGKNSILLVLTISGVIMMGIGVFVSKHRAAPAAPTSPPRQAPPSYVSEA